MTNPETSGLIKSPEQIYAEEYCQHIKLALILLNEKELLEQAKQPVPADLRNRAEEAITSVVSRSRYETLPFRMRITIPKGLGIQAKTSRNWVDIIDPDPRQFDSDIVWQIDQWQIDFHDRQQDLWLTLNKNKHLIEIMHLPFEATE